jgi:tetratricopeptide (TPR) repeat protein
VCQQAGQLEAAEDAYRKSLEMKVRLGDIAGQAATLAQMGNLYSGVPGRAEESVAFDRQAVDKYVDVRDAANEGRARSNLANHLRSLHRLDEARQEIRRAIECKAQFGHALEPWTSWAILNLIESEDGNPTAAAEAKRKAIEGYLAYRYNGGENHNADGRICLAVTQALLTGDLATAVSFLDRGAADPDLPDWLRPFVQALQAIVAGSRDRTVAYAPDMDHTMAAEILFLIETLEKRE